MENIIDFLPVRLYYKLINSIYLYTISIFLGLIFLRTIRLYIADIDDNFVSRVRAVLSSCPGIEIVGNSNNGMRALNDIIRLAPDVLLTDIPIPDLDGIALLKEVRRLRRPPQVIVCTRFYSDASMQCACKYGASFFLCKPIELRSLPGLILECGKCAMGSPLYRSSSLEDEEDLKRVKLARDLLRELGISPHLSASAYILESVQHLHGDDLLFRNLSHGLYAKLAGRFGTTVPRIERSLRSAISIAYERGSLSERFSHKPTNKEFMEYIMSEMDRVD